MHDCVADRFLTGSRKLRVAPAFQSGKGHPVVLAEAICACAEAQAAEAVVSVATITEAQWTDLDRADAIAFGVGKLETGYLGQVSAHEQHRTHPPRTMVFGPARLWF